ncbi:Lar family restriction alleviation protein, partial [Alistipes sp.]|uniref:Lar family restriction alleviation protein n=1 Tax=Alistipes sp. TaxID=1872444 RepID=UPI003AAD06CC
MSEHILKPCPFCGSESMLGEVRPATRKSPPLFGITCIHCGAEMTDEFVASVSDRYIELYEH